MRAPVLLPVYRPGASLLHRAPAALTLAGLGAVALLLVGLRTGGSVSGTGLAGVLVPLGVLAGTVAAAGASGVGGVLAAPARRLAPVVVLLAAYQAWARGWVVALEVVLDLLALVLLAAVVSATSPVEELLDVVVAAVRPLSRLPRVGGSLHPERVALVLHLAVRSVDVLVRVALDARDAARARGRGRDVRALVTPTVVRAVAHARAMGDALAARGLAEPGEDTDRRSGGGDAPAS